MTPDEAIDAFWAWWSQRENRLVEVIGVAAPQWLIEELSEAVRRIDEGLVWEYGPGQNARHALAVSGEGDPKLRMLAERWRQRGPASGPIFEFHSTRQPLPAERLRHFRIRMRGLDVAFDGFRCEVRPEPARATVDVAIYHPSFSHADREARLNVAFIALDQTLGEDGVERWLGCVDVLDDAPADAVDLLGLKAKVDEFSAACCASDAWIVARGEHEGQPLIYVLNPALKRWDYPFKDTWCVLSFGYADRGDGLPDDSEKIRIDALEEALVDALGDAVVNIGRATGGGRRRVFFYMDGASDAEHRVRDWARRCVPPAHVEIANDPGWNRRPG